MKTKYGVVESQVKLINKKGTLSVPKDDEYIKQSLDYISKGGGGYIVRVGRVAIKSEEKFNKKSVMLENVEIETKTPGAFNKLMERIFK